MSSSRAHSPLEISSSVSTEKRLTELGITLPAPPEAFGIYVEPVQTGNLLFLTGKLPTQGHEAKFIGRVDAELGVQRGRKAAHLAALNALAVARERLGSLDKVTRVVRFGVLVALRETSVSNRKAPMVLRSCCKTFSERTLAAWSTELRACRSA